MSNQPDLSSTRLPSFTQQASLQAQRSVNKPNPTNQIQTSRQSVQSHNSSSGDTLGNLPSQSYGLKPSKRNSLSLSSTADHYSHSNQLSQLKYENTYSLGPNDSQKFNVSRVQRLVNDILTNHLENFKYEPNKCRDMVQLLSDEIKTRVKSITYKRFKLIVNLTIGQNIGNSIMIASRSLWNTETDNGMCFILNYIISIRLYYYIFHHLY
jgi:hypothetical protein